MATSHRPVPTTPTLQRNVPKVGFRHYHHRSEYPPGRPDGVLGGLVVEERRIFHGPLWYVVQVSVFRRVKKL